MEHTAVAVSPGIPEKNGGIIAVAQPYNTHQQAKATNTWPSCLLGPCPKDGQIRRLSALLRPIQYNDTLAVVHDYTHRKHTLNLGSIKIPVVDVRANLYTRESELLYTASDGVLYLLVRVLPTVIQRRSSFTASSGA